jgi:hypothetical protein
MTKKLMVIVKLNFKEYFIMDFAINSTKKYFLNLEL